MKKILGLVTLLAVSALPALAQGRFGDSSTPVFEIGGGYAFRSWGVVPDNGGRTSFNGFDLNADYNVTQRIGFALDGTWTRNSGNLDGPFHQDIYSYMGGPRFYPVGHKRLTPFVHALFGLGRYTLVVPGPEGFSYGENDFAFAFGGGIDATVTKRVAVRLGQVDYERTPFTIEQNLPAQNNFRFSAGVVIRFGEK